MALDERFMVKLVSDTISTLNNRKLNDYKKPILQYITDNKITKKRFLKYKQNTFTKTIKTHLKKKSLDSEILKLYNSINTYFEPTFTVGDTIQIDLKNRKNTGIIRFIGEVQGRKGTFYGIELYTPKGTNNGTLAHIQYFKTKPNRAIFIKKKQYEMQLLQQGDHIRVTVGNIISIEKLQCNAVVRFIGILHFKNDDKIWYGVQLEEQKGKNNGTIKDRKYFRTQNKYGLFVRAEDITLIDRDQKYLDAAALELKTENMDPELENGNISHSFANQNGHVVDSDVDDDISYASSADFAEYDLAEERIHFFVVDASKMDEFKQPVFARDIDVDDDRYVGVGDRESQIDIGDNLKKLKLNETDCMVLAFKEVECDDECVLERVFEDKYFDVELDDFESKVEQKNEEIVEQKVSVDDGKSTGLKIIVESDDDGAEQVIDFALLRKNSQLAMDKTNQLKALRMKYSSRKVILHGKSKAKQPRCTECNMYYHIQSDPLNAYDGVGIFCDICGKNRRDNPELILEDTYYTCEGCGGIDICKSCYMEQKKALKQQFGK